MITLHITLINIHQLIHFFFVPVRLCCNSCSFASYLLYSSGLNWKVMELYHYQCNDDHLYWTVRVTGFPAPFSTYKKTIHGSIRPNTFSRKEGESFRENVNFSELAVLASPLIIRFFSAFHIFAKMSPFHIYIYNMGPYYICTDNMGPHYIYIICTLAAASWEALAMSVWLTLRICKKDVN